MASNSKLAQLIFNNYKAFGVFCEFRTNSTPFSAGMIKAVPLKRQVQR
jgi:hypothetical protein